MLKEIILVTVLYVGFVFPSSGQTTTSFNCEGAEVYMSITASLFSTCSDLYIKDDNLWNEGQFYAEGLELIECKDAKLGSGTFNLHSDYGVDINGDFIQFGTFNLDLPGNKLSINSDCEISNQLFLKSGLVSIDNGNSIFTSNTDEDAIIFNNSIDNDSYIRGSLKRKIASKGTYYFPVGNESSFHPFCLSDALSEDEISVIFDENVPFNWESSNVNSTLKLEDVGGWIVSSDYAIENNFVPIVSKLDYSQNLLSKELNIFHSNDPVFFDDIVSVSTTVETPTSMYLQGTEKKYTGAYALLENVMLLQDIPNTIVVNERNETRFKVEIDKFKYLKLSIYDSFGREIYKSRTYSNDFDAKDFSSGTYYYYLEGEFLNGQKIIKNNILEIIRAE